MATRSMIAFWNEETGIVTASYCHYDGYVLGVGQTLVTHYNTDALAQAIATIGYASALEPTIADTLDAAVHKNESPTIYESVGQYIKTGFDYAGAEYLYLWDGEAWFVAPYGDRRFTDVETVLNADPRTEQMISNF